MYHTIGQRQGLGIGGVKNAGDAPWYVADKNLETNQLLIVQGGEHPLLYHSSLEANQAHWINANPFAGGESQFRCRAKIRYRQADQDCTVSLKAIATAQQAPANTVLHVEFDEPQRAITPGQSIVFYDDNRCLGGAVIQYRR